jgi:hypothetical protein
LRAAALNTSPICDRHAAVNKSSSSSSAEHITNLRWTLVCVLHNMDYQQPSVLSSSCTKAQSCPTLDLTPRLLLLLLLVVAAAPVNC